jgi:N-acetylmuramoyl-L-alanine amidase
MGLGMTECARARFVIAFACVAAPQYFVGQAIGQIVPAAATPPAVAAQAVAGVIAAKDTVVAGDKTRTRFVIGLERAVEYQVFSLGAPNRVIVELPEMKLQLPVMSGDAAVGLVRSFRGGVSAPGKTRIVIDVTSAVVVEKAAVEKGKDGKSPRLVLEIVPVDAVKAPVKKALMNVAAGLGATGVQPPMPKAATRPDHRADAMYKPIIVIDPGHGGHDSGAQKYGTVEKDVVLAFSLKLRDKLNATGRFKVLLTRDNDRFVELDERRSFGDRSNAALFIAVHADYAGSSARGATIYSLRDNTSRQLQRSAKGEVSENVLSQGELDTIKKTEGDVGAVRGFLASLAQREVDVNKERTSLFSKSVIEFMGGSTPMMSNPDREANFRVLKSVKTPSVLIELAYVTNQQDAQNLRSDQWRDKVTNSILTAIENYFTHREARIPM